MDVARSLVLASVALEFDVAPAREFPASNVQAGAPVQARVLVARVYAVTVCAVISGRTVAAIRHYRLQLLRLRHLGGQLGVVLTGGTVAARSVETRIVAFARATKLSRRTYAPEVGSWHVDATSASLARLTAAHVEVLTVWTEVEVLASAFERFVRQRRAPAVVLARIARARIVELAIGAVVGWRTSARVLATIAQSVQATLAPTAWVYIAAVRELARIAEILRRADALIIGHRGVQTGGTVVTVGAGTGVCLLAVFSEVPAAAHTTVGSRRYVDTLAGVGAWIAPAWVDQLASVAPEAIRTVAPEAVPAI